MRASNYSDRAAGLSRDASRRAVPGLAQNLYALVVYLHKNCNADLFAAVGALELTLTQIKLLQQLEQTEP